MTTAVGALTPLVSFLGEVAPSVLARFTELAGVDRERVRRFLSPEVELALPPHVGAGVWLRADQGVAQACAALEEEILARRTYTPSEQQALLQAVRRRAEAFYRQAQRWSAESLERLFERSPMPMMLLTPGGEVVFSNEALNRLSQGDVVQTFAGRSFIAAMDAANPELRELSSRIFGGEPVGVSSLRYRSVVGGHELVLTLQSFPLFDAEGALECVCLLLTDETERSVLARRLDHSRRLLGGILDAIGDPVVTCDPGWLLQSWNRAAMEVLGLSEGERGRDLAVGLRRAGSLLGLEALEEQIEVGGEVEVRLVGAHGEPVVYGVRVWEMPAGPGEAAAHRVVVFRDMRQELERQHHLLAAKEHLEQVNRELRHLNDAKVEFMNIVSHELRSPLVTIRGYIEMILRGSLGELTSAQRQGLEVALRNGVALSDQIETLLDYSRIEQGRMSFTLQPVRVCDQLRRVVEGFRAVVGSRRLALELRLRVAPEVEVQADAEKLRRAVRLLLDNAIKFTEQGEVGVEVSPQGGSVEVVVWDTGPGITHEHQRRIFETFYQVDLEEGGRARGTGLGLPVAYALIEGHGSRLEVESAPGVGSRFRFMLRCSELA